MSKQKPKKILRDNIDGLTKPSFKRLAQQAGAGRVSKDAREALTTLIEKELDVILKEAIAVMECRGGKTLKIKDVKTSRDEVVPFNDDMDKYFKRFV